MIKKIYPLFIFFIFTFSYNSAVGQQYIDPDSSIYINSSRGITDVITLQINEFMAINTTNIIDENDENSDWIELYNYGEETVNLNGLFITDDLTEPFKHQFQFTGDDGIIQPGDFRIVWADNLPDAGGNHLNFALSGEGGDIGLFTSDLFPVDGITYYQQLSDVSYGRMTEGSIWNFFTSPTPNESNTTEGNLSIAPTPVLSHSGGIYENDFVLSITTPDPDCEIYYTLNNSEPDELTGILYSEPITITNVGVFTIRARAFKEGSLPGFSAFATYIFNETFTLPIVALQGEENDIWGMDGIYSNVHSGLEKPVEMAYFNPEGEFQFSLRTGMKIHAPDSRPQQSLRLYSRSRYGQSEINYQLFLQKSVDSFRRIVLRNGGNDGQQLGKAHFRDMLAHKIFNQIDPLHAYSAFQPVHVYLNGQYWGIYNMRERQDEYYIQENYGFDDVDFLEKAASEPNSMATISGDWDDYNALKDFVINQDLADDDNYEVVKSWMDIENYVDYMVTEIWTGNRDWLSNNVKFWRPRNVPEEKWRWVLWDTEYGLGCYPNSDHGQPEFDALLMSMTWGGWPPYTAGASTYLMRNLADNDEFVEYYITRAADLYNTAFRPENVLDEIEYFETLFETDMPKQAAKWNGSITGYNNHINLLESYTSLRPSYCRQHIIDNFEMALEEHLLTINIAPEGAGYIKLNTIIVEDDGWDGYYFEGVPVKLEAVANPGYTFENWSSGSTDAFWTIMMENDMEITANFQGDGIPVGEIVINEINYKSSSTFDSNDWIELHNTYPVQMNLGGYKLKDEQEINIYQFPEDAYIEANGFLVICRDSSMFVNIYPEVLNFIGNIPFGLSNTTDQIRLFKPSGEMADFVEYSSESPWPQSPNGNGQTLELIAPDLENENPANWFARSLEILGSPGAPNDYINSIDKHSTLAIKTMATPNPFSKNTFISVKHSNPGHANVYDIHGRIVATLKLRSQSNEGLSVFHWNANPNLPSGIYICRFSNLPGTSVKIIYNPQ